MATPSPSPSPPPRRAASSPHSVFVYGTLMAEEVVRVLLGRVPPSAAAAVLPNHQRFSIKGRVYPAILPVDGAKTSGKVFKGITDKELNVLDIFEDEEYTRKTVEISLTDTSEKLLAYAYIWGNQDDPDLYGEWDFEEWKRVHLEDYLIMTKEFMEELEQPESKTQG